MKTKQNSSPNSRLNSAKNSSKSPNLSKNSKPNLSENSNQTKSKSAPLEVKFDENGKIYSLLGDKFKVATPEEVVRQNFVAHLVNAYSYELSQMQEEVKPEKHGKSSVRADIVIWRTPKDKQERKTPLIVVECKADNIRIGEDDYQQGEGYARVMNAPFFVTHNSHETRFWRILKDTVPGNREEIKNIPKNHATDKAINTLFTEPKTFIEDEFAKLLEKCHDTIRNNDALAPSEAFDEISKILFMKVYVEREILQGQKENKFNLDYINKAREFNPDYLADTFEKTKKAFEKDELFDKNTEINLKESTVDKIIKELEGYNLTETSVDIKGIAFEKFLGTTFRGNLGQFFTPRSVVEFMVEMINPQENEVVCDPASGSGGFLIRVFNKMQKLIAQNLNDKYEIYKKNLLKGKDEKDITEQEAKLLDEKRQEINAQIEKEFDPKNESSKIHKLSNHCIFGTDANDRMARTSKMNMIMHGDGHGGIHHHNGLLNVNGIFEKRFDFILTNPPFGAQVEKVNVVQAADAQTRYNDNGQIIAQVGNEKYIQNYYETYGKETYQAAQRQILDNIGQPIASLFALKPNLQSDKTEHLFINRCLDLLKPGGRLGIVLPEGVFNTPNAEYVGTFVENKAFLRAVISLPSETFKSADASVKCSVLFLQKFTQKQQTQWDSLLQSHKENLEKIHKNEFDTLNEIINYRRQSGESSAKFSADDKKRAKRQLKELNERIAREARTAAKADFSYPIFMAEPQSVGINAKGETQGVANDLQDRFELQNGERVLVEKGVATHFREFLREFNIAWSSENV